MPAIRGRLSRIGACLVAVVALTMVAAPSAGAAFDITHFDGAVEAAGGVPAKGAGEHPAQVVTELEFATTKPNGEGLPDGSVRNIVTQLPPGLVGNPTAVPQCTIVEFRENIANGGSCKDSTAIGMVNLKISGSTISAPIYNLLAPPDEPALFGFHILTASVLLHVTVRSGSDYGLTVTLPNVSQALPLFGAKLTLWGVPADASHNSVRGKCLTVNGPSGASCPAGVPAAPFLTNPTSCTGPMRTDLRASSWQEPGRERTASFTSHAAGGAPTQIEGCSALKFEPTVGVTVTPAEADSPGALGVNLHVPQNAVVGQRASAELKRAVVTLPAGVTINPASANGLGTCSVAASGIGSENAPACPDSAKVGSAEIITPLLSTPLRGSVYLAEPTRNQFGSLLAVYLVASARGVSVKLPGRIDADPASGRLTATFDNTPQLPFSDLHVDFFGGARGALATPSTCGSYEAAATLTPWSGTAPVQQHNSFPVSAGPAGGACPSGGFAPKFSAGSLAADAGAFSPFVIDISREDGTQRLTGLDMTLPKGMLANLAGIPYCSDAALAAIPTAEGTGAAQAASPACPAASQVGRLSAVAGVGSAPFFLDTGRVYLAGPYKGAPLSLALAAPALAGPFDLGNVLVRVALRVNPANAQVEALSDPIPTMLAGIPLDLREIRVNLDRKPFILNPTNCTASSITARLGGDGGASAGASVPFQASHCGALGFGPQLALKLTGPNKRGRFPALTATLTTNSGDAGLNKVSVALPHSEFLAENHLAQVCTRPVFEAGSAPGEQCPANSIYGVARAYTPLLDKPLEGPVYLRPSGNLLPDLVATLRGQLNIDLDGRIDSVKGGIRTTFEGIPDAPLSKFELVMKGGAKGLLVNSTNICAKKNRAAISLEGQNGKSVTTNPVIAVRCRRAKRKHKKH